MTHATTLPIGALFLVGMLAQSASATPAVGAPGHGHVRRFAFLAGVNDGGVSRPRLRYATTDARSVARVLGDMGGVAPGDVILLVDPDRAAFLDGLERMQVLLAAPRGGEVRRELVFYYSGHSDEEGLLLRGERLLYSELRARIDRLSADVRVAVLDSCASGAMTREKGGVRRPPFLVDASAKVKGHAFLTSSSADEVAQESDRIAASFFTHYLLSGLRGAADVNRDARVTLMEAYQFAFQETLARTEKTRGGAQHAAYDIQLAGTGDLVITDVRSTSAGLILAPDLGGRLYVRDSDGRLVAELRKAPGHPVELGLEPGSYTVTMDGQGTVFEARAELREGQRTEVAKLHFRAGAPREIAVARGDVPAVPAEGAPTPAPAATVAAASPPARPYRVVPFSLGIMPLPGDGTPDPVIKKMSLALIADRATKLDGFQLSTVMNWVDEDARGVQLTSGVNVVEGPLRGAQVAAAANSAGGDVHGWQVSAGANVAWASLHGAQLAAGANVLAGNGRGLQATAGVNWANARFRGAQVSAGFNGARTIHGAQIAVINWGGDVDGAQVGIVNVAGHVRGTQVGVINVAGQHDGTSVGIVSVARNGILNLDLWSSDVSVANVGLKVGAPRLYTTFVFGADPRAGELGGERWSYGLGFGGRFQLANRLVTFIDTDLLATTVRDDLLQSMEDVPMLGSLRVVAGHRLKRHFALIAGPTLNVAVGWSGRDLDIAPIPALERVIRSGGTTVRIYPGIVAGLQI